MAPSKKEKSKKPRKAKGKSVSLVDELLEVAMLLEAGQELAERLANKELPDDYASKRAPHVLKALFSLGQQRILLVRRVIRQDVPVEVLLARHNYVEQHNEWDDPDLLLTSPASRPRKGG